MYLYERRSWVYKTIFKLQIAWNILFYIRSVGPIMWEMKKCYLRVNEQRNILHEIRKRKVNWIGHILRRNCLLKRVIEGKIKGEMEVARRRGRRRKKLLDDLKERRGYSHLKEETLDRTMWRHRFGGGFGPVVRQNTEWMNSKKMDPTFSRTVWNKKNIDNNEEGILREKSGEEEEERKERLNSPSIG